MAAMSAARRSCAVAALLVALVAFAAAQGTDANATVAAAPSGRPATVTDFYQSCKDAYVKAGSAASALQARPRLSLRAPGVLPRRSGSSVSAKVARTPRRRSTRPSGAARAQLTAWRRCRSEPATCRPSSRARSTAASTSAHGWCASSLARGPPREAPAGLGEAAEAGWRA
jgi:hypothetical protein